MKSLADDAAPGAPATFGSAYAAQVEPWLPVLAVSAVVAAALLLRRPLRLVALAAPAVPAVLVLLAAEHEPELRRIAPGLMIAPVVLGCAWALVADRLAPVAPGAPATDPGRAPTPANALRRRVVPALGRLARGALVVLVVFGVIPSWLSPTASWRVRVALAAEWKELATGAPGRHSFDAPCTQLLLEERAAGEPFAGDIGARWLGFQGR